MPEEEEKEEVTEEEMEEETEEGLEEEETEMEEETEEPEEEEMPQTDMTGIPLIYCLDDEEVMEVDGVETREIEQRKYIINKEPAIHQHVQYTCRECGRVYYHDMERQRQGCFIATAAYGTPLASQIDALRKFRDSYLVYKGWGKAFVSLYYKLSPPIADVIGRSERLKKIVRTCLKPLVEYFEDES